ncbi:MAG: HAD hydrolase family protein, partial [Candidatus Omnitrophota bacterium]
PVIVSDLDGTLSESNLPIAPEMADAIIEILKGGSTFAVLSGISKSRVEKQFIRPLLARLDEKDRDILNNLIIGSDNGTQIYQYDRTMRDFKCIYAADIRERLSVGKYNEIFHHIYQCIDKCGMREMLKDVMGWEYTDEQWEKFKKECVVKRKVGDKVTQITFMVVGHEATHEQKEQFQNKGGDAIRERYQKFIQDEFKKNGIDLDVKANGLSSIDITLSGIEKGFGIRTISKVFSIPLNCIIFFGDAFSPGRNDEPAIKIVDRVVNVGKRVDIAKSSYHRKTVRFLQMAKGGPRGARLFAEAFARQIRRLAPASRTSVYADAMTSEEALDMFNSPEFGQGNTGAILFKMGLPEVLRRAVIERLHKSGISTYRFARVDNAVGFNALMKLWGDGIIKSLDDIEASGLDVSEGRRTFAAKEDAQFTDWIYRLYNEVVVDRPDSYSKDAIKAVKTLVYSLDCLNRSVEVVLVKSRVSRSELVRAYAEDEDTANRSLREKLGDDTVTHDNCEFQDFLKHIVVGATNVNEAHQFSLRGGIIKPDLTPEGSLREFVHSARHFEVSDATAASIANGIHCAGYVSLWSEKDVYKVIEDMSDAARGGVSEASQVSAPGTEIDHDSFISIGEVTRSGFLRDIVEKRYAEIEASLGIRGRSVLPAEYCANGGTIAHERITLRGIPEKNIPDGLEIDLIQTPWRAIYRRKMRADVSYSVTQPHGPAANEKVCVFCHLPKEEVLFNVVINNSEYMVAVNIRPFGDKHLMLISKEPVSQDLSMRMEDVLLFVNAMGPEYEAMFNSPGAAASKLHFHAQVFKTRSPLRDNMTNGLVTRSGTVEDNGVRKSMLLGWFGDVKELVSNDPVRLAAEAQKDIDDLKDKGITYSSVMFVKRNGNLSVLTVPRESEAPLETLEFDAEGVTKFGANDIAGNVVANSSAVRDAIVKDPQALANALYAATKRGVLSVPIAPEYVSYETALEKINALKDALRTHIEFIGNIPTQLTPIGRSEEVLPGEAPLLTEALDDEDADVRYFAARCLLLCAHLPSERARASALSVWLQHVVDLADSLLATEDYEGAVINYDVFLNSAWVNSVLRSNDMDPLLIRALSVTLDVISARRDIAGNIALSQIRKAKPSALGVDILLGIPKSVESPGLAKMIRDMADSEFPKMRIGIYQMSTDSPDELIDAASSKSAGQGLVLDLPQGALLAAAKSYLGAVERERFNKNRPEIVILNESNVSELSRHDLAAKLMVIHEALPTVSATSIEELKNVLVERSRNISSSFAHTNSPQLNLFN